MSIIVFSNCILQLYLINYHHAIHLPVPAKWGLRRSRIILKLKKASKKMIKVLLTTHRLAMNPKDPKSPTL